MMAQSVHSLQGAGRAGEHMLKSARDDALRWLAAHCIELDRSEPSIWADARPVLSVYALCHQGRRLNFSRLSKSFVHEVQELHQTHRKDVDVYAKECRPFVEGPILERTGRTTWVRQLNDPSALLEEAEAQKNSLSKRFFDAWGYHAFYAAMLAGQRVTFSLARSMESTLKIWYLCEASGFRDCALTDEARAALDELVEDCGVKIHERIVPGLGPYAPPEGSENEMGFGVEPDWVKEGQEYTAFNDPRRSVEDVSTSTW